MPLTLKSGKDYKEIGSKDWYQTMGGGVKFAKYKIKMTWIIILNIKQLL